MGKCSLHAASESRAVGHSVQNATEDRGKERPLRAFPPSSGTKWVTKTTCMMNEDKDVRLSVSQCFLMAAGVKCKKLGTCKTTGCRVRCPEVLNPELSLIDNGWIIPCLRSSPAQVIK